MKKYFITAVLSLWCIASFAQVNIGTGAQWVTSGTVTVTLQDMSLVNNGIYTPGTGSLRFTGSQVNTIGGTAPISLYQLIIEKDSGIQFNLSNDISISNQLSFISGFLNLNQKNISLTGAAVLFNENENSRIIGSAGGEVIYTTTLNAPSSANPGNIGAIISSTANLGTVTIKRGHTNQSGTGLSTSISRYYTISPQNNTGLNATFRFNYFDAEKNGLDENSFVLYQSNDNGTSWNNLSQTTRNTASNYVEKTAVGSLSKFTLGTATVIPGCSATGVVLTVKAGKQGAVNVTWTTATETNNKGFAVERRLKSEQSFTQVGYVNSKAIGGNSASQLSYSFTDNNSYADTSYYRLRIESLNNSICYSDIKILVPKGGGGGKGKPGALANINSSSVMEEVIITQPRLTVGPNPNNGYFFFSLDGIMQPKAVVLYTIDGKIIGQYKVSNNQRQQVSGLRNGLYILKAEGIEPFKVMVQGSGTNTVTPSVNSSNNKY